MSARPLDVALALAVVGRLGVVVAADGTVVVPACPVAELARRVVQIEAERRPRWVWWQAQTDARSLVMAGVRIARCWDVAEVHRLLAGQFRADPGTAWAWAHGLDPAGVPPLRDPGWLDFFDEPELEPDVLLTPTRHLRPDAVQGHWQHTPRRLADWAAAALDTACRQRDLIGDAHATAPTHGGSPRDATRLLATAMSESAAALLCLELERDGLPLDRPAVERLITEAAGTRPRDEMDAAAIRARRDDEVRRLVPGHERVDLRNPAQVKDLLASVGVVVPDTRKWTLDGHRTTHPVVEALLQWRKAERIATTYGWSWLDAHVGSDDRLRGAWTACDGGAGRMTAANGLHNLPAELRSAVAAPDGFVLIRADLGQIEPRVLAAVARDQSFADATRADDLYAPVAKGLAVERPIAKVAVLAAMYGQTSGSAGQALKRLDRAYPDAMAYLKRAHEAGVRGEAVTTWGGRLIAMWQGNLDDRQKAARGRFARNAVIQGAAAELFKAWAATVRAGLDTKRGAQVVLCLHDELLVLVPRDDAQATVALLHRSLHEAGRRWTGTDQVRFVADVSIVCRWSEAKG